MEYRVVRTGEDELYHYGVKGMKWGVRRAIGDKAKVAAQLEREEKYHSKKANKLLTKQRRLQNKRIKKILNDPSITSSRMSKKEHKLFDKHKKHDDYARLVRGYRSQIVKDLSKKDINQGRRYYYKVSMLTGLPFSMASRERDRAARYINENFK